MHVSVSDKENADNGRESDIFSPSRAGSQHFVMRFAWPLAITEWSVIYTQSWFTTPKLRWILSMATLSSFNPFLHHLPSTLPRSLPLFLSLSSLSTLPSDSGSALPIPNEDKDRGRLHVSSRYATVSTFNYTCMDTVPHKSPRLCPREKRFTNIFETRPSTTHFYILTGDWKSFQDPITIPRM